MGWRAFLSRVEKCVRVERTLNERCTCIPNPTYRGTIARQTYTFCNTKKRIRVKRVFFVSGTRWSFFRLVGHHYGRLDRRLILFTSFIFILSLCKYKKVIRNSVFISTGFLISIHFFLTANYFYLRLILNLLFDNIRY